MTVSLQSEFMNTRFPPNFQKTGLLHYSVNDLAHALFTTGRAPGDQALFGMASYWELVHRVSLIPAYLRRSSTGFVMRSPLAFDLDRSEKVGLSFALGQAMTAVYCRQQLGVRFLMHVDRYAARYRVRFQAGRSRPDFIGCVSPQKWVVAEAKGRSSRMELSLPLKLAAQKSMVRSIRGYRPWLSIGCVASFPPTLGGFAGQLRVDAVDPPISESSVDIAIDETRFIRAYYEPFVTAMNVGDIIPYGDSPYITAKLPSIGMEIGVLRTVFEAIESGSDFGTLAVLDAIGDNAMVDGAQFPDGTIMKADWDIPMSFGDVEEGGAWG